jgi:amidohydrolase
LLWGDSLDNTIRTLATGYIENISYKLESIVDTLFENPETSFNEEKSSQIIIDILSSEGFSIEKDVAKIKHSFVARYGSSSPRIAYICEYDSIEGIGHGCGHNITSAINVGAAIGLKRAIDSIGGSVVVIGCPAEEKLFSKIIMYKNGVFNGIDAIICGHARDKTFESGSSLGMAILHFTFKGKEAHTSLNFRDGINALSPNITLFNLIEAIKSRYAPVAFINGIITHGGKAINLIPGESRCMLMIKGVEKRLIDQICDEIIEAAKFAAKLHKCDLDHAFAEEEYMPLKTHRGLSRLVCHNLKERGILNIHGPAAISASLDIGNVSHKIPTVHPYIGISDEPVKYYSKEFAEATITPYAKENMLKAACALALTGIDIIEKPDILNEV